MSLVEDVTSEALTITRQFVADAQKRIGQNGQNLENMTLEERIFLSGIVAKMMRAATGMVKEARALMHDAREAAQQMSFEDKRKLIVDFIAIMPPEQQQALRAELGWTSSHGSA